MSLGLVAMCRSLSSAGFWELLPLLLATESPNGIWEFPKIRGLVLGSLYMKGLIIWSRFGARDFWKPPFSSNHPGNVRQALWAGILSSWLCQAPVVILTRHHNFVTPAHGPKEPNHPVPLWGTFLGTADDTNLDIYIHKICRYIYSTICIYMWIHIHILLYYHNRFPGLGYFEVMQISIISRRRPANKHFRYSLKPCLDLQKYPK